MSTTDELRESTDEELKEEPMIPSIRLEYEPRQNAEIPKIPKLLPRQIADKLTQCLTATDVSFSAIIEFLDILLTHMKRAPIASQEFTRSIYPLLFTTKQLVSKNTLIDSEYYDRMRKILVVRCILELRVTNSSDDDMMLASDILLNIRNVMEGSSFVTVMDVLIDIDEEIRSTRSIRSSAEMKIVHKKYLSKSQIDGPVELDDTNFIKHLILFHLWYEAENISEKPNVLEMFLSTIKPSRQLRSNPIYGPYLLSYNDDEVDGYKRLIQQPLDQKSLVIALRQVEMNTDCYYDFRETIFPDLTGNETSGEVNNVDDNDNEIKIDFLPPIFERVNDLCEGQNKIRSMNKVSVEIVEISSDSDSDSDAESIVECPINESDGLTQAGTSDILHPRNSLNVRTYSRTSNVQGSTRVSKFCKNPYSRNQTNSQQSTIKYPPLILWRSAATDTLNNGIRGRFRNPLLPESRIFVRYDYKPHTTEPFARETSPPMGNSIEDSSSHSDSSSSYTVTGPQFNYPYLSAPASAVRRTQPISLSQNGDNNVLYLQSKGNSTKRAGLTRRRLTSVNTWIKRKKVCTVTSRSSVNSEETQATKVKIESTKNPQQIAITQHSTKQAELKNISLQSCDMRNDLTPIADRKSSSLVKTKKSNGRPNGFKSKSGIKSKRTTFVNKNRKSKSRAKECSVRKLKNHVVQPTSKSAQIGEEFSYNPVKNQNESIGQFPVKSPQEYQFKRSFIKKPTNEVALKLQAKETLTDATVDRTSNPCGRMVPNNQLKLPALLPIFKRTPRINIAMEKDLEFSSTVIGRTEINNQSSSPVEIEALTQSTEVHGQTSDAKSSLFKLTHNEISITTAQELNRNATNCSPDTTISSVSQCSSISYNDTPGNEMITGITNVHNPMNIGKQSELLSDDCDNDIPSPPYTPFLGRRKSCTKQKSCILKTTKMHPYKCIDDHLTTPIDDVNSTQFNPDQNVSLDTAQSLNIIGERLPSRRREELSAIAEITNDRFSSELN